MSLLDVLVMLIIAMLVFACMLVVTFHWTSHHTRMWWRNPVGEQRIRWERDAAQYAVRVLDIRAVPTEEQEAALAKRMTMYLEAHQINIRVQPWEAGVFATEYCGLDTLAN